MYNFGRPICLSLAVLLFYITGPSVSQSVKELFQMDQDDYNREKSKPVRVPENNSIVDFIIVGGGPAGCVIANRLSENPNWNVLLLEAGSTETIINDIPVLTSSLPMTHGNWNYSSTPQKKACRGMNGNVCALPRGKLLGGTSCINFLLYTRGNPSDYDHIARAGNYGWSYKSVLPYFLKSERANSINLKPPYHNTSGLLGVERVNYRTPLGKAFVEGCKELGYPEVDYNGEDQLGVSFFQTTTLNSHRNSAAKAFIEPIINKRKNLRILTFAHVTKILIDEKNLAAYGVEYVFRGKTYNIIAKKEVILSAGTFNSPQLLLLSGIGPKDVLSSVGIKQLVDLPVGKIMYEHMSHFGPTFTTNTTRATVFASDLNKTVVEKFENGDRSTIASSPGGLESIMYSLFHPLASDDDRPKFEIAQVSGSLGSDDGSGLTAGANIKNSVYNKCYKGLYDNKTQHFTMVVIPLYPLSIGKLWLKNSNPFTPPIIEPNYFDEEEDIEVMVEGIKEGLRIAGTPAMKRINAKVHACQVPGCERHTFGSDDYWRCSIKVLSYTVHHQVGSCKMGTYDDLTAVVSPELKVHRMRKLRVADCSILPRAIGAHTNAPSMMIGEKAADMIKNEWMNK